MTDMWPWYQSQLLAHCQPAHCHVPVCVCQLHTDEKDLVMLPWLGLDLKTQLVTWHSLRYMLIFVSHWALGRYNCSTALLYWKMTDTRLSNSCSALKPELRSSPRTILKDNDSRLPESKSSCTTQQFCDLRQVNSPICSSVSLSIKWGLMVFTLCRGCEN